MSTPFDFPFLIKNFYLIYRYAGGRNLFLKYNPSIKMDLWIQFGLFKTFDGIIHKERRSLMMDIQLIRKALHNKKPVLLDIVHESAVLIPIVEIDKSCHILFQVRSLSLSKQPGEICFPGGKIEPYETPMECAIRETSEELNILENNIEVMSALDYLVTPFNMAIYSFCGILKDVDIRALDFNQHEVSSIFTVPIEELLRQEPKVSSMMIHTEATDDFPFHLVQNGKAYDWKAGTYPVYFYEYNDYVIWGITAKILKAFLDTIK